MRREPVSSTPLTVPFVPAGGACASSIRTSSTRVPTGYSRRMRSTISLLGNCMADTSILERRGTGQVLKQDLALRFIFAPDKAQPQEKAAKSIYLIIHRFLGCCHPLGVLAHLAVRGDEVGVGFDRVGLRHLRKPGEYHSVFQNLDAKVLGASAFLIRPPLAS